MSGRSRPTERCSGAAGERSDQLGGGRKGEKIMRTGRKIFASVEIINGEIAINLNDNRYEVVKGADGVTYIVERESKQFIDTMEE